MTQPVQSETEAARAASARQRIALGAVIAGISIAALFYVFKDRTGFSLSAFKELASGEPFRLEPLGKVSSQKASQVATNSAGVGGKGADVISSMTCKGKDRHRITTTSARRFCRPHRQRSF